MTKSDTPARHANALARMLSDAPMSADEREAIEIARIWFDLQASKMRAVERGEAVQIEIPVVVCAAGGYLAMEVDTTFTPLSGHRTARDVAQGLAIGGEYRGTPYVIAVTLPAFKAIEAAVVVGDVAPC